MTTDALFSIVLDTGDSTIRRLPTFFYGGAQLFADRDIDVVKQKVLEVVPRVMNAVAEPFYFLNACRIGERWGLYGRDFFNRAIFRLRLQKLGMEFSADPFVRLHTSGEFSTSDWGRFRPRFLILGLSQPDPPPIMRLTGAPRFFMMNTYRLGELSRDEFRALGRLVPELDTLNSRDPATLVGAIQEGE